MGKTYENDILVVEWSPDGKFLAASVPSGMRLHKWIIWGTSDWNVIREIELGMDEADEVNSLTWSPDGNQIASASTDGKVYIWDIASGQSTIELTNNKTNRCADNIDWSPNGLHVAGAGCDEMIYIWNSGTGLIEDQHSGGHKWVSWSPDGSNLAIVGDREISLWKLTNTQPDLIIPFDSGNVDGITNIEWSFAGKNLASGFREIMIWNTTNGQVNNLIETKSLTEFVYWKTELEICGEIGGDKILCWQAVP